MVDGRVDAPQEAPDLVVGAQPRVRGEVARVHAVDLAGEFPEPGGEARARHEVQELQGEEERHDEHHHDVEQHLEQHVVDERGVDPDVQYSHRLAAVVDRQRHDVLHADARRLRQVVAGLVRDLQHHGVAEMGARPDRLGAARVEDVALGVGDRHVGEFGVLLEDVGEGLLHPVELPEVDAVTGRLEQQCPHRGAHGRRLLLGLRDELAVEDAVRVVRHHGERDHDAHHDHAGEPPVDAPEIVLLEHR
jgi:hypothetical protein